MSNNLEFYLARERPSVGRRFLMLRPLSQSAPQSPALGSFRAQVEALERELLTKALEEASGNQSEAARKLSLSRATFLDKLKRHGIT